MGCDIVLDRDQDHNDLDKCLLTVKDRNKDKIVDAVTGGADVKVSDQRPDVKLYDLTAKNKFKKPIVTFNLICTVTYDVLSYFNLSYVILSYHILFYLIKFYLLFYRDASFHEYFPLFHVRV